MMYEDEDEKFSEECGEVPVKVEISEIDGKVPVIKNVPEEDGEVPVKVREVKESRQHVNPIF